MSEKFPAFPWLLTAALLVTTASQAEAPPWNTPSVRLTPEIIRQASQASQAVQPPKDLQAAIRPEQPMHDLFRNTPRNLDRLPNGCGKASGSLCYDYRTGRAVYKPMRKLMPDLPGMTPHNLSIRRDKIVAQYTFK